MQYIVTLTFMSFFKLLETVESGSDSSGEVEANESAHDMFEEEKEHRKDTNTGKQ